MTDSRRHHDARPAARAFTLTELLVAIAAVGLVTLGVGQIFTSVGRLTSLGRANAETDALARAVEQRLREDFENFSRMAPDETFLAIRMREIGDIDRNGSLTAGERPIYLSAEDALNDRREVLAPYEVLNPGQPGEVRSRAVTRRLDEIIFLARAPEGRPYVSQQIDPGAPEAAPSAAVARIYWGHALRPRPDPEFPPEPLPPGPAPVPVRQYLPDGDFGLPDPLAPNNVYNPGDPTAQPFIPTGRNRFASEWILARQPLLLFGGTAVGHPAPGFPQAPFPIGANREYAPYISDIETLRRYRDWGNNRFIQNPLGIDAVFYDTARPDPRLIQWGRVDICAQNENDVRRWIEGEAPGYSAAIPMPPLPAPAGAFGAGYESVQEWLLADNPTLDEVNAPLWKRASMDSMSLADPADVIDLFPESTLVGLRSAIAGCFVRLLADDQIVRTPRQLETGDRVQPEDSTMDLHAIVSSRCSNFEIAWSDGRRAVRPIDYDADGDDEIFPGDLIFFDISPADTGGAQIRRRTFAEWRQFEIDEGEPQTDAPFEYSQSSPRAEVPGRIFANVNDFGGNAWDVLLLHAQTNDPTPPAGIPSGFYSSAVTGGDREPNDPTGTATDPQELLAVWGFRLPTGDGGYGAPWPKPAYIRVRVTLHDSQNRLPNGKTYEFVFSLRSGVSDGF